MPKSIRRKIEVGANIAIISVAILLGIVLVRNLFHQHAQKAAGDQKPQRTKPELIGKKAEIPGMNWDQTEQTLLLALQPQCKFCTESAPFYQKLATKHSEKTSFKLVAVSPVPVASTQQYLASLGVSIPEVKQATLQSLGLTGTPSLVLVDKTGIVKNFWLGKLRGETESEVLSLLQ